ncbi:unnamed protein product [Pedinophyceae sp. YPF-701]|nr:unnamed protein product [Pedinophyceae sp. YPF-701]
MDTLLSSPAHRAPCALQSSARPCRPRSLRLSGDARSISDARRRRSVHDAARSGGERATLATALRASSTDQASAIDVKMEEMAEFLRKDLVHLFDDVGIDRSMYSDKVEFRDPLTKYGSISGYLANIKMLGVLFRPQFFLHDVRRTGEYELTTRWTMSMKLWWSPLPFWRPSMEFTGESFMTVDPEEWKFNRHIDIWDSIQQQEYLSKEAFQDLVAQLGTFFKVPDLETPQYMLLRRAADYEVRRYEPYSVAEYAPATADRRGSFQSLARYIFGGNARGEKMAMTTPVFTEPAGRMQFVMGSTYWGRSAELPPPLDGAVATRDVPGGVYAVRRFSGRSDPDLVRVQHGQLRAAIQRDGLKAEPATEGDPGFVLAQYNEPSTPDWQRLNEVLVPLSEFDIWEGR